LNQNQIRSGSFNAYFCPPTQGAAPKADPKDGYFLSTLKTILKKALISNKPEFTKLAKARKNQDLRFCSINVFLLYRKSEKPFISTPVRAPENQNS
jgi:hypothetical protein